MKDEYLKAYQQRIEEIKALDVSPKEKRKLAADAKDEILEQYKVSYGKENNRETVNETVKQPAPVQSNDALEPNDEQAVISPEGQEPKDEEQDPIDNILNKLEEREERGEVGIEIDAPTEFMDPDALFETMNLDELFSSLGIEDEDDDDSLELTTSNSDEVNIDDAFINVDDLFAGLLDDFEDELNSEVISEQFDLGNTSDQLIPNPAISTETAETFIAIVEEEVEESPAPVTRGGYETPQVTTIETDVEEIEELVEGSIIDDQDEIEPVTEPIEPMLDSDKIPANDENTMSDEELEEAVETSNLAEISQSEELEELEKERERAQKLGAIELILVIILIVLVIVVVRIITMGV